MFFKILVIAVLALIVVSLASALFSMVKNDSDSDRTVKALTVRIALSVGLLIVIMLGYSFGLITPHGIQ